MGSQYRKVAYVDTLENGLLRMSNMNRNILT